jgi:capsular exopolysaccharide synthesis family protein
MAMLNGAEVMDPRLAERLGNGTDDRSNALGGELLAIGRGLLRHKVLIAVTTFVLTAIVAALTLSLTPKYSATSYVMIEPGQTQIVDAVAAVVAGSPADSEAIESETRVIQSRDLADRVVDKLQLDKAPEFNASLRRPGALARYIDPVRNAVSDQLAALKRWLMAALGAGGDELPGAVDRSGLQRAGIVDAVLGNLSVSVDGRSRVIGITFASESADTAADGANTFAALYIVMKLEAKFATAKTANEWLNERLAGLRQQVETSEAAAEEYRAKHGLIANGDVTITTQEATDIGAQLALARSQSAEAEARLHEVQSVAAKPGGTAATSAVLGSALVQSLRMQEADVQRKVSQFQQQLGSRHPDLLAAQAELNQIRSKIAVEVAKIVDGLRNEVNAARAREASLSSSLEGLKGQAGEQNEAAVKLRALEREATAGRTLLQTFLQRAQETSSQESYQRADAHVVSKASTPRNPSFPKTKMLVGAGFIGAGIVAVLLALAREYMDRSLRSEEQMEEALGVPSLGLLPSLKRPWGKSRRAPAYVAQHPLSIYVESIRNLYTGLRLSNGDHWPRTILIASSLPDEGKTTVAASLASLLSLAGLKTIIVDTDLRNATVRKVLAVPAGPGLVDYLRLRLPIESVVQRDKETGIDAITAGSGTFDRPDLLGADRMKELLARLAETYDAIILDSAPLLAVSDARVLVRMVDKTVFLVRWGDTDREAAQRGLQQVMHAGGSLAGTMLTMVDLEKYAKYQYGSFGRYYPRIKGYYAKA